MNIFNTKISDAVQNGSLTENYFLVRSDGSIKPLKPWVSKASKVNNVELSQNLSKIPTEKITAEFIANLDYLQKSGRITSEIASNILYKVKERNIAP